MFTLCISFVAALLLQLNQLCLVDAACTSQSFADGGGTEFIVKASYEWNKEKDAAFPNQDPSITPGFKILACATHNSNFTLWKIGTLAGPDFKQFFVDAADLETVDKEPFDSIRNMFANESTLSVEDIENGRVPTIGEFQPPESELRFDTTVESQEMVNVTLKANLNFPFVSCFAMLYPSSDWFVGVSNINVCELKEPNKTIMTTLFAYDAGIYKTLDYVTGEEKNMEPEPNPFIRQVRVVAPRGFGTLMIYNKSSGPPNAKSTSAACFPADETVLTPTGGNVRMDQLSIGDLVQSTPSNFSPKSSDSLSAKIPNLSRIIAFSHRDSTAVSQFVRITYQFEDKTTNSIRLSPGHFIYRSSFNPLNSPQLVKASDIKLGDILIDGVGDDRGNPIVVGLNLVYAVGLYNPHSSNGDLVVGGIVVSCFTDALEPKTATAALLPIRLMTKLGLGPIGGYSAQIIAAFGRLVKQSFGV